MGAYFCHHTLYLGYARTAESAALQAFLQGGHVAAASQRFADLDVADVGAFADDVARCDADRRFAAWRKGEADQGRIEFIFGHGLLQPGLGQRLAGETNTVQATITNDGLLADLTLGIGVENFAFTGIEPEYAVDRSKPCCIQGGRLCCPQNDQRRAATIETDRGIGEFCQQRSRLSEQLLRLVLRSTAA